MKSAHPMKRWLAVAALAAFATLSAPTSAAPVLSGSATLNLADDLTVVQDGAQVLQFLDLPTTLGMSVAGATAAFGGSGFHWATGAEVAKLYSAFGFTYLSLAGGVAPLTVSAQQATSFVSYLGATFENATLGWIDDNTDTTFHTFACISATTCQSNAFVASTADYWPLHPQVAVYMVRDASNPIPEPGMLGLVGWGLLGILALRRRRDGK